jgi:hypothetical protein
MKVAGAFFMACIRRDALARVGLVLRPAPCALLFELPSPLSQSLSVFRAVGHAHSRVDRIDLALDLRFARGALRVARRTRLDWLRSENDQRDKREDQSGG